MVGYLEQGDEVEVGSDGNLLQNQGHLVPLLEVEEVALAVRGRQVLQWCNEGRTLQACLRHRLLHSLAEPPVVHAVLAQRAGKPATGNLLCHFLSHHD